MRRRHIALIPASEQWKFAVAFSDRAEMTLLETGFFTRNPQQSLADQLSEILGPLQMTDRLACTLPARSALLRWVEFPFDDPRKIAAAASPEMARQLPENLDDRTVFHQNLGSGKALTVAIAKDQIEEFLGQFDDNHEPLGYLGLSPFCHVSGLNWPVDSLLLCIDEKEITISRIENANLVDLCILPQNREEISAQQILQQAQTLAHSGKVTIMLLKLLGESCDSPIANNLKEAGFEVEPVLLTAKTGNVATELSRVASLALGAAKPETGGLNLRSGPYRLKNDWQALKKRAGIAASLLLVSILLFVTDGYLQYHQRTTELSHLQQQMNSLYQKQFSGEKMLAPAPLLLQSKLKALQKKSNQFGTDSPGALQVLLTISENIDPDLSIDIREYLHNDNGLRISGSTESFDAVSQLLSGLQQGPLFKDVRILDSKQTIDGRRVDFQLQIQLGQTEDNSR